MVAVGWIDLENKYCTRLILQVYSREPIFLRQSLLGDATIVLKEFMDKYDDANPISRSLLEEVGSFQLRKRNSNKPQGFVDVSIRISEEREEASSSYLGSDEGFNLTDHNGTVTWLPGMDPCNTRSPIACNHIPASRKHQLLPIPLNYSHHSQVGGPKPTLQLEDQTTLRPVDKTTLRMVDLAISHLETPPPNYPSAGGPNYLSAGGPNYPSARGHNYPLAGGPSYQPPRIHPPPPPPHPMRGSSAAPNTFCKNLCNNRYKSPAFSSWGKWPQFLIISRQDPGMAREILQSSKKEQVVGVVLKPGHEISVSLFARDGFGLDAESLLTKMCFPCSCNAYVKAWKRLTIHRAPNILTIALKRFQSGRFGKLNKRVTFPETLDLSPYMSEIEDGNDIYKLYAVIVHLDMLNASYFGHYISYVKGFCGNWYRIDDCKVANVDLDEVLSQGAYMLMYRSLEPSSISDVETASRGGITNACEGLLRMSTEESTENGTFETNNNNCDVSPVSIANGDVLDEMKPTNSTSMLKMVNLETVHCPLIKLKMQLRNQMW
ncbi:hypothetical protein BUALT_Bualt06G0060400 [Buddleja alternifolia]|uniref:USP domain-containing protein n=1 Tax=Buddleja alternifolia TaxID=168488 RepID=A0AAV6XNY4_9LAMI|nr:hypothetical protein BUALT_Bualt06G0060400 [Buddleja alternifolia]